MATTLKDIARIVGGELHGGSPDTEVTDIAEIQYAQADEVTFIGNAKYFKYLKTTQAAAVILPADYQGAFTPRILVHSPQMAVRTLVDHFRPPLPTAFSGIHPTAVIDESVNLGENISIGPHAVIAAETSIGDNTRIEPNVTIGQQCRIGEDCHIFSNVTLYDKTILENRVIIHSGTVLGSDGYSYVYAEGVHHKIRQVGCVHVESDVEIGANCTIDRAALSETVIGAGSKLDNLIQVGHNVRIGQGCLIVSQVGISGSTVLGDYVTIGGQAGIAGHITIGDKAIVASQAGVTKDVAPGLTVSGYPAKPHLTARRHEAYIRKIPDLASRIKALEAATQHKESE